ncbi:MAG TPA: ABC transporter substrate-binding protein [Trebonia sp.]|nr:ABC transporter substrate-binding protein [Trebonia sp.]
MRTYRRSGYAVAALAAGALAVVGCSSSSSSSSTPASSSAATPSSSSAAVSTASGSGGLGAQSVTNYLTYVGGKAGAANSSLAPVTIGYMNEQGDANPPGLLATSGAELAVNYINKDLGGVDGHPLKLDTCFTTTEAQGGTCADQFLADKSLPLVATGGVATGAQTFFNTIAGKMTVIDGVAVTPFDAVSKNTVILFGDSTHVLGPMGAYATSVLHAKTASVIYPETAGITPGALAIEAGLKAAGVTVTMAPYPVSDTNLTSVLAAAHASTADMVVPYADATDCVNLAKALQQQGITDAKKIVSAPLCLSSTVIQGLGDFPKWTYSIASSLFGDTTDPGMPAYEAVSTQYKVAPSTAADPWQIVNFGELLTIDKLLNQVGYANITQSSVLAAAQAFKGPQALGAPSLDCGQFSAAPAVCNDQAQFFEYNGKNSFTKVAGWTKPPANESGQ